MTIILQPLEPNPTWGPLIGGLAKCQEVVVVDHLTFLSKCPPPTNPYPFLIFQKSSVLKFPKGETSSAFITVLCPQVFVFTVASGQSDVQLGVLASGTWAPRHLSLWNSPG
jgi:hypothetical protein